MNTTNQLVHTQLLVAAVNNWVTSISLKELMNFAFENQLDYMIETASDEEQADFLEEYLDKS